MSLTVNAKIREESVISASAMAAFLLKNNPSPRINCSAQTLAELFIGEGRTLNIRADIAWCQSIHETGWFKYGGQVLPDQNNYAGIGATNNSPVGKGAWFESPQIGARAQMQHLYAYCCKDALPASQINVDPRFSLVTRGVAPTWEGLNGKWAVPGTTYAQSIIVLYNQLEAFAATYVPPAPEIVVPPVEEKIPEQPQEQITEQPADHTPSGWAQPAWEWAKSLGLTDGTYPKHPLTREQAMQLFFNFTKLINANIQVYIGPLAD